MNIFDSLLPLFLFRYEIVVAHRPHINPDTMWSHTKVKEAHEYYLESVLGRHVDDAAKEWIDALVMGTIWCGCVTTGLVPF